MTESPARHRQASRVSLVVADVDGTLLTPDKIVTPRARAAVRQVMNADIAFTITSGRPPRGMKALIWWVDKEAAEVDCRDERFAR